MQRQLLEKKRVAVGLGDNFLGHQVDEMLDPQHRANHPDAVVLRQWLQRRLPGKGLLAHSDRGSQYASDHYQRLLAKHGMRCSMSRRADCWDNAPMESFFASLKKELIHDADFATRLEARAAIFEYIEVFYNNQRRHSSLGYVSPAEYEQSSTP